MHQEKVVFVYHVVERETARMYSSVIPILEPIDQDPASLDNVDPSSTIQVSPSRLQMILSVK